MKAHMQYAQSICIMWKLELFHLPKIRREPTKIGHIFRKYSILRIKVAQLTQEIFNGI